MKTESIVRLLAGTLVLASVILTVLFNPWWLLLAAFMGINLMQSAVTGICPAEFLLAWLRGPRPD